VVDLLDRLLQLELQVVDPDGTGSPIDSTYAAPEQWRAGALQPAVDVYRLGLLSYVLLTGCHPFAGPAGGLLPDYERLFAAGAGLPAGLPPAASTRVPGLGPAIDGVLRRALTVHPGERYPTCGAVVAALCGAGTPTVARHDAPPSTRSVGFHPAP
jgi:serine/threonine-protein kinase